MERILIYGLSEQETKLVKNCGLKCDIIEASGYQDIMGQYASVTIINPIALPEEGRLVLLEFFQEIDPVDEKVIITSGDDAFIGISFVEIIPDLFMDQEQVSFVLMKCMKQTKRDVDFSRRIMLSIKILHLISQNPGISSQQLANIVEISVRSIKRYIRSLQAAGIFLEYKNKGWYCMVNPMELI